jgi:succinoglycan biosynthesis transport protein ExoP
MRDDQQTEQSELRATLQTLARRKGLILLCMVVAGGAAFTASATQQKQYSATASLLFRAPGFDQTLFGSQVFPSTDPTREAATNVDLASLQAVADKTARALGRGLSGSQVSGEVSVSPEGQSDLVSITATDPSPSFAAKLADQFAESFVAFRRGADRRKVASARRLVESDYARLSPAKQASSQGQALQHQISQLSTLEALQTGNAEVVQQADVPSSPSSPKTTRNTILAGALGLLFGLGLAFLLERLDRRVRDPSGFEQAMSMPTLGAVPESKSLAGTANGTSPSVSFADSEAFRMLRTRLRYFNIDKEVRSVLVTSAAPRDGKSTVAWHLAFNAASSGVRTVLLEADFHQPTIAKTRGADPLPGLSEVLTHQAGLDKATQRVPVGHKSDGERSSRHLDLVVAGATPPNPAELLESKEMATLLSQLADEYALVVIDTPPVSLLADAIPLMKLVGGVLVVGQLGKTTRDEATHLAEQLRNLDAPVLGIVANRAGRRRGYGYRYGYGYEGYYGGANGDERSSKGIKLGRRS